jgi:acetoin utilization deacetylase AcuC-like enzyme
MTSYFFDLNIGDFFYENDHPMKPIRINMVHDLVFSYGIHNYLKYNYPRKLTNQELLNFHKTVVIDNLFCKVSNQEILKDQKNRINKQDCPIFMGVIEYCQLYAGASISAASDIINRKTDIAINWAGGLHHAKRSELSGFCYVNDIVLLILELLRYFSKIFYIDIDIHHGDGVEEAFYLSNRVFSLSFHSYDKIYFPGTGNISSKGYGVGKYYSANVPLKSGIDDDSFEFLFKPIVKEIIENFNPNVIVFQSGADSLLGDKLGLFNLSITAHGRCVKFVKDFSLPMIVLGGGGYSKKNVAHCWTLETSILVDKKISLEIPYNSYWEFFYPNINKIIPVKFRSNKNSKKNLDNIKEKILCNIKKIKS